MNMIPALPFRAEPWVEDENFNDAFAWMEEWHNPTASERRGSLLAAAGGRWQQQSRQGQSLANALRNGVDLRPRGEHAHDAHNPAQRGEQEKQSE
jgi:hypothetical protein